MFSELCRETLRKAAVCYSSARAGSPSPSPPTSPPSSPAKEAKTAANADLANVRDASHEGAHRDHHYSGTIGGRRATSPAGNAAGESRDPDRSVATDRSNDFREYVYARWETEPCGQTQLGLVSASSVSLIVEVGGIFISDLCLFVVRGQLSRIV
ncbi:hypothetical protein HN011_008869 [Eciton burchellii]|nr:hypothetical protein HN011_008869 [Eciton burchellii]